MRLYRGFNRVLELGEHSNIFFDGSRSPTHADLQVHLIADQWFFDKFGVKARSCTVICTTDYSQACSYGYVYRIIPQGPYKIVYSPNVKDFCEYGIALSSPDDLEEDRVLDWLENSGYVVEDDFSKIKADFRGEVMVWCEKFNAEPFQN